MKRLTAFDLLEKPNLSDRADVAKDKADYTLKVAPDSQFVRMFEHRRAVASNAPLDFFPQERQQPAANAATSNKLTAETGRSPRHRSVDSSGRFWMPAAVEK